jgi:hypothetical protein
VSFLSDAKFAASSFLSYWKSKDDAASTSNNKTPVRTVGHLRDEAKRTWTIRKLEFDKLRALRRNETIDENRPKQRFFHTSMLTDLSEKSSTIKKIDEIEAQMSMQWWKTDRLDYSLKENSQKPY